MSFESDLMCIIHHQFDRVDISYDKQMGVYDLATQYLEMLNRRIDPTPRTVYFSNEIHTSLGNLARETDLKQQTSAWEAWNTTFLLYHLLSSGENVNRFLSRGIKSVERKKSRQKPAKSADGLLWDFGMHHFHLSREIESDGFVRRSDYLLFALITQDHAYIVDVRPHRDPEGLVWVRQDLLKIVDANWPKLIKPHIMRGVTGDEVTDKQKKELRRKNIMNAPELGGRAVGPLGGGTMLDGSSTWCRVWTRRLLHEIKRHQDYFDSQPPDLRSALASRGVNTTDGMEFDLVLLHQLDLSDEVTGSLGENNCFSRYLSRMGFAVVERTTRVPIEALA